MALPETEVAQVRRWAAERVPEHVRDDLWVEVEVDAISVTIVECSRSPSDPTPLRVPMARLRYVATRAEWELYCIDASRGFRRYTLAPPARHVAPLLRHIDEDVTCIFWG